MFLVGRPVHAGSYLAGINGLLTAAFYAGRLETVLVASQLF